MNRSLLIAVCCVFLAAASNAEERVKRYLVAPSPPSYCNPPPQRENNVAEAVDRPVQPTRPPRWVHTFASPYEILFGRRPYALGWI